MEVEDILIVELTARGEDVVNKRDEDLAVAKIEARQETAGSRPTMPDGL